MLTLKYFVMVSLANQHSFLLQKLFPNMSKLSRKKNKMTNNLALKMDMESSWYSAKLEIRKG